MNETRKKFRDKYAFSKLESILNDVCMIMGEAKENVISKRRYGDFVLARHLYHYIAAKNTPFTLTQIGKVSGGRDHATVLNSKKRILELIEPVGPNNKIPNQNIFDIVKELDKFSNPEAVNFEQEDSEVEEVEKLCREVLSTFDSISEHLEELREKFKIKSKLYTSKFR